MHKKITDNELEDILKQNNKKEFKPFFSTRVIAKLEKYDNVPIFGILIANRIYLKQYLYAACIIFLILFGISFIQEGSVSIEHLLGLGNYSDEDIINYTNPLI